MATNWMKIKMLKCKGELPNIEEGLTSGCGDCATIPKVHRVDNTYYLRSLQNFSDSIRWGHSGNCAMVIFYIFHQELYM